MKVATLYDFKCTKCDYTAQTAGEPSALMSGPTIPVVCEKCLSIIDEIFWGLDDGETVDKNWKCHECRGKKYYFWDYKMKPCPQCKVGVLEIDPNGLVVDAD